MGASGKGANSANGVNLAVALNLFGEIAREIALKRQIPKMSARAVGRAVGANPIAIIIPCHRVIGSGDKLTGYAYGLDKKHLLLNLEKSLIG